MLASELINALQEGIAKHGDLHITTEYDETVSKVIGLHFGENLSKDVLANELMLQFKFNPDDHSEMSEPSQPNNVIVPSNNNS